MGEIGRLWRDLGQVRFSAAKEPPEKPAAFLSQLDLSTDGGRRGSRSTTYNVFAVALLTGLMLTSVGEAEAVNAKYYPTSEVSSFTTGSTPMTEPSKIERPKRYKPISSRTASAHVNADGELLITWNGRIRSGMAYYLRKTYDELGRRSRRVYFRINSGGGTVSEGERVIKVLRMIKRKKPLTTVVGRGGTCASMCVPIYLQGTRRIGARTSIWMFHEVSRRTRRGKLILYRNESRRLFREYYAEAGVSRRWLRSMLEEMRDADVWRTGQALIDAKTRIITHPLSNRRARR